MFASTRLSSTKKNNKSTSYIPSFCSKAKQTFVTLISLGNWLPWPCFPLPHDAGVNLLTFQLLISKWQMARMEACFFKISFTWTERKVYGQRYAPYEAKCEVIICHVLQKSSLVMNLNIMRFGKKKFRWDSFWEMFSSGSQLLRKEPKTNPVNKIWLWHSSITPCV